MRTIIKQNKADWIERDAMTADDYAMQKWIDKLDRCLVEVESRWGVDRLPKLVTKGMADKWSRQMDKINTAIRASDIAIFPELVDGAIRGCGAMEAEARTLGHTPHDAPLCWTVRTPKGNTLAIVRHAKDAELMQGHGDDVLIWTIDELAALVDGQRLVDRVEKHKAESMTLPDFDFTKGDEIEF
jgi:hypothetical protein